MGQLFNHIIDTWDRILTEGPSNDDFKNGARIACTTALGALSVVGVGALLPIATIGGTVLGATISGCFSAAAEIGEIQGEKDRNVEITKLQKNYKEAKNSENTLKAYQIMITEYNYSILLVKSVYDKFCNVYNVDERIASMVFRETLFSFEEIEEILSKDGLMKLSSAKTSISLSFTDILKTPISELDVDKVSMVRRQITANLIRKLIFVARNSDDFNAVVSSLNLFAKVNGLY